MRVWVIEISDFLPKIDGENRLYRAGMLANALVEARHDVIWWSSTFNHQLRKQRYKVSTSIEIEKNYHIRLLHGPGYSRSVSIRRWLHNRTVARQFAMETAAKSVSEFPDIIYACYPTIEVCQKAVHFGIQHGIPVVIDVRELLPDNYLTVFPAFLRPIFRVLLKSEFAKAKYIFENASAISGSSEAYRNWGLETAKRKSRSTDKWFPLGMQLPDSSQLSQSGTNTLPLPDHVYKDRENILITFVGSFTSHYDFKTILKVASELSKAGEKRVQFIFVGDGDYYTSVKQNSLNHKNVHLAGWCKKPIIDKILEFSSIGIAPYSFSFTPTIPNKPLEYMAAGLPILSSLEGELLKIIEQQKIGLQYKASDSDELRQKIDWFLSHPEERQAMGRRAKALFEKKYNCDIVYPQFVNHLTKIANEGVLN